MSLISSGDTISGMNTYSHKEVEKKWSSIWLKEKVYEPDLLHAKDPYYNLMMFPYPSAEGLHVGNMYAFSGADIYGRFQRMHGKDVFEPIGLDGFGIHSENYAIKIGKHPAEQAKVSEKNFYRQLQMIGNGFSWNERLETYDEEYYRWTQWLFIQMHKNGLAYKASAKVNWCPSCKTVLADEQVENGLCERCKSVVERREASQWFFKITEYAERLLKNIDTLKWPEKIKTAQRQWIGKKEGIEISYNVKGTDKKIVCFTTRSDTNFGATFIVLAPESSFVQEILSGEISVSKEIKDALQHYVEKALHKTEQQRQKEGKKKTGAFTGLYAINQLNGKEMPIWVSDFVLMGFGTGAVVGVPGHDLRDFQFAKAFNIPVVRVVIGKDGDTSEITEEKQVQEDEGVMMNSSFLDGMNIHDATSKIMDYLVENGFGKKTVSYHLRDWLISRQRYWGPPIPMIYCKDCGWQEVPEEDLPVKLPNIKEYIPKGDGKSPLENAPKEWLYVPCPKCGKEAKRETDVSDTFLDSSWYFLRYPSLGSKTASTHPFDPDIMKKWLPVNTYIGGAEHAVLHLLYSRFVTMALKDWGHLSFEEPFPFLFGHGLIIKDGAKMSKSKGNVVNPDEYIEKFGADTLRTYLMFLGAYDQGGDFRDEGIAGMYRFLQKVWNIFHDNKKVGTVSTDLVLKKLHKTIKKCTEDMTNFKFNTSIASLMECMNVWTAEGEMLKKEDALHFLKLLAPFAPFMTEEMYQEIFSDAAKFSSIHTKPWPSFDHLLIKETNESVVVQINGKMRVVLELPSDIAGIQDKVYEKALEVTKISSELSGRTPKKIIFIAGKILNLVV